MPKKPSAPRGASTLSPLVILTGALIVLLIAGGSALFSGCLPGSDPGEVVPPPPPTTAPIPDQPVVSLPRANVVEGSWYTVYFTKPTYPEKTPDRAGGIDQAIIGDFERAQQTIDVAVFDLRLPSFVDALVRAARRGVKVRAIVDYSANSGASDFTSAIQELEQGGVSVVKDHRSALMHNKFAVIDNRLLWTGSMNFTANDVYRNNNNMLRLSNPALIQNYNYIFDRLFLIRALDVPSKDVPNPRIAIASGITVENYFSPNGGARDAVLKRLRAATKSIRATAFSFTDTAMGEVLKEKSKQGLKVQGVFESRNNTGLGAEYPILKRAGVDVLEDGNCYTLHSKLLIIDDKTVIMGSYNFTDSANRSNDENLLIIDDPALAKSYTAEFNRIYKQAQNPTQCGASPTLNEATTEQ